MTVPPSISSRPWYIYIIIFSYIQVLEMNEKDGSVKLTCLGSDMIKGDQQLQYTVPPNVWFGAFPTKDINISSDNNEAVKNPTRDVENHFSLVGCTCAPAFQFEDFELAKRSHLISLFPAYQSLLSLVSFDD